MKTVSRAVTGSAGISGIKDSEGLCLLYRSGEARDGPSGYPVIKRRY